MTLHEAIELHREQLTGEQILKIVYLEKLNDRLWSTYFFLDSSTERYKELNGKMVNNEAQINGIIELLNHPDERVSEITDLINTEITQAIKDSEELLNN
jgi:hypothetical protein